MSCEYDGGKSIHQTSSGAGDPPTLLGPHTPNPSPPLFLPSRNNVSPEDPLPSKVGASRGVPLHLSLTPSQPGMWVNSH